MNDGYTETPHMKAGKSQPPKKAKHKHEYIRPFYMNRIRRFDGSVSTELYKFELPTKCRVCDKVKRGAKPGTYTEIEVSVSVGRATCYDQ